MPASPQAIFEFVEVWNAADSIITVARNYGVKPSSSAARARRLRALGLPLKQLPDEAEASALSRPPKAPPKPRTAKEPSNFVCHVQTMVTYADFGRLLRGAPALTAARIRAVLRRGLDAEDAAVSAADAAAQTVEPVEPGEPPSAQSAQEAPATLSSAVSTPLAVFDLFGPLGPSGEGEGTP